MQIKIHAPFEVNALLKDLIDKKISKLQTFYARILRADVFLKLEDPKAPDGKIVEINLSLPGKPVFAKEKTDAYEKAIAYTAQKLERQLKKRKDKLKAA
ncbi:MAG: ribosome-associated translation inhibitor RaiA [Saprospiraceae bacterium]